MLHALRDKGAAIRTLIVSMYPRTNTPSARCVAAPLAM